MISDGMSLEGGQIALDPVARERAPSEGQPWTGNEIEDFYYATYDYQARRVHNPCNETLGRDPIVSCSHVHLELG